MGKYKLIILLLLILIPAIFPACKKYYANNTSDGDNITGSEDNDDYYWDPSHVSWIVLNGTSVTENSDSVTVDGCRVTIGSAGTYGITGSLTDGQIIIDTRDEKIVRLIFDGVDIKCSSSSPVYVKNAVKAMIVLGENTQNYISDGTSYSLDENNEPNAAIFSKSYLSFYGIGSVSVKGNYNDGITGKDGLVIKSGNITVTSVDDGIRGKDYLEVKDGTLTVNAGGDGLKSDNETDTDYGYISVEGGTFKITAAGDGISAETGINIGGGSFEITSGGGAGTKEGPDPPGGGGNPGTSGGYNGTVSAKGLKSLSDLTIDNGSFVISSADDALHADNSVTINGGNFLVQTGDDAIHAEKSITFEGDTLKILSSYEGIESASININDGYISMVSSDDAFNATKGTATEANDGSCLYIRGGNTFVNASGGDGIDSNGNVVMTAGTMVVNGPKSQPEVGIDVNGTFNISGGLLLATGPNSGNMIEATSASSEQYAVKITTSSTLSSSSLFHIEDADGNNMVTFKPVRTVYYIIFSSPDLTSSSTYSIFTGGTSTGENYNGLYTGGIYSGGTFKKQFVISGKVTNVSF
jgi:hypothetical protein